MGHELLNLNEPPVEERLARYVMLEKDQKPICRTLCVNPAPVVPPLLAIRKDMPPAAQFSLSHLPKLILCPASEDSRQLNEWGQFMGYLRKKLKVAISSSESCDFYILPPDKGPDFSHAVVRYHVKNVPYKVDSQELDTSVFSDVKGRVKAFNPPLRQSMRDETVMESHEPKKMAPLDIMKKTKAQGFMRSYNLPTTMSLNDRKSEGGGMVASAIQTSHVCNQDAAVGEEFGDSSDVNGGVGDCLYRNSRHSSDIKLPQTSVSNIAREPGDGARSVAPKQDDHLLKNFIRADPSYLNTLGQTHSGWIFGAIAELVDNSRDANATRLDISIETLYSKKAGREIPVLSVIDDGHGMSHPDIVRMLSFGHKQPDRDDPNHIGRFGIGFKTGAMRLGRDAIVLTQTSHSRSIALLSQSFNEDKDNVEIPLVSYCRQGHSMEVDLSVQSEASEKSHLQAIRDFSPFNEYFIGEKLALFREFGTHTGTQIYIWNLDEWGPDYSLEWESGDTSKNPSCKRQGDILIRSRRIRSRPGQISLKVPLDYSLQSYLEVIFLDPRMKIYVQSSLVKSRPLAKSLNRTIVLNGDIKGKAVQLTLGRSQLEWERMNCGMFLYWHGRLIEAYKRVGGMVHNADMGRGVIGVIDVTNIMIDGNGRVWVHSNKQGFQDSEVYAKLEEWLGNKADEYWDKNFDRLDLKKGNALYKPDHEYVQCDKCRKWRILSCGFDSKSLPAEWFCYMPPFNGNCGDPEQQVARGVITVAAKRSGFYPKQKLVQSNEAAPKGSNVTHKGNIKEDPTQAVEEDSFRPVLKRLRRGPARDCKKA